MARLFNLKFFLYLCWLGVDSSPQFSSRETLTVIYKKMRIKTLYILSLSVIALLSSCDKYVGTDGIVIDKISGERIPDVIVKMTSEQGNKNDISNDVGYFHTGKSFSCGISSCNTDYKIEFSKEGYNTKVINENFYSSSEAEFLNADKKDTLIIKLDKI